MWLGMFAVIVAVSYALIKFLSAVHMRRLLGKRSQLNLEVQRTRGRVTSLEGKLQVASSRMGAIEQKLNIARRFKQETYDRLLMELPTTQLSELRACINRNPVPEPRGVKIFHELELSERISATLGAMSVAVFQFRPGAGDADVDQIESDFIRALEAADIPNARHSVVDAGSGEETKAVVCTLDDPSAALELTCDFIQKTAGNVAGRLRGVVLAGVNEDQFQEETVSKLFAGALERAMQLAGSAPDGTLLFNRAAYESVGKDERLELFSKAEKLYVFKWQISEKDAEDEAGQPAGDGGADKDGDDDGDPKDPKNRADGADDPPDRDQKPDRKEVESPS